MEDSFRPPSWACEGARTLLRTKQFFCASLLLFLLLLSAPTPSRSHVVTAGLLLPLRSADPSRCATAWQHWAAAQSAVRAVNEVDWWVSLDSSSSSPPLTFALDVLPYATDYEAFTQAEAYTVTSSSSSSSSPGLFPCNGGNASSAPSPCRLLRSALLGPSTSHAAELIRLVSRSAGTPHLVASATSDALTPAAADASPSSPLVRLSYADEEVAGALFALVRKLGWELFAVLHARDEKGAASAAVLERLSSSSSSSDAAATPPQLYDTVTYASADEASVDAALERLGAGDARIIVLFGGGWVGEATWAAAADAGARAAILRAMQGVVGVGRTPPHVFGASGAGLDRFTTAQLTGVSPQTPSGGAVAEGTAARVPGVAAAVAFPAPTLADVAACRALAAAPYTSPDGIAMDEWTPFVYDSVWALADAVAAALRKEAAGPLGPAGAFSRLSPQRIGQVLSASGAVSAQSPLTATRPAWLPTGDRVGAPLSLLNVVGESVIPVGQWVSAVTKPPQPKSTNANASSTPAAAPAAPRFSDGAWAGDFSPAIVWPSGTTVLPTDRTQHADHLISVVLVTQLAGMVLSLIVGALFHKYHISAIPESAAVVCVGLVFGAVLRLTASHEIQANASFNGEFFMLVLLPIIIFESGFSLDRGPFFTQLFSINAFAIAGTVISTIVIGGVVFAACATGALGVDLSFEESFAFASLLSATDPVATLAVFGALKVDPTLNALVYGESVINDAVSIVLYRSFTNFLLSEITTKAALLAVLGFVVILVVSVLVGIAVGLVTTLVFRLINLSGILPAEAEGRVNINRLLGRVSAFSGAMLGRNRQAGLAEAAGPRMAKKTSRSGGLVAGAEGAGGAGAGGAGAGGAGVEGSGNNPVPAAPASPGATGDDAEIDLGGGMTAADVLAGIAETALLLLFAYLSFAAAEAVALSGIVSSLFCGIAMGSYTTRVMSIPGRHVASGVTKMLATLADTSVFFQIGLNVMLRLGVGEYFAGFIAVTLVACIIGRALNVFPIAFLLNCGRVDKISPNFQLQMFWAGLRGAIAFASALTFPTQHRTTIVNATSWICLFTIFAMGSTTTPLLRRLKIPYGVTQSRVQQEADAEDAARVNPVKRLLFRLDELLRRLVYGKTVLALLAEHGDAVEALSPVRLLSASRRGLAADRPTTPAHRTAPSDDSATRATREADAAPLNLDSAWAEVVDVGEVKVGGKEAPAADVEAVPAAGEWSWQEGGRAARTGVGDVAGAGAGADDEWK
jgi:NhaP-type Na+/H+ or K+/H+ antiporter